MVSADTVRSLALALPEAHEQPHFGRPSFRVGRRIFATLREDDGRAVLKLSADEVPLLTASQPDAFRENPWSFQGWVTVQLGTVDRDMFEALLVDAWRRVAPKRVVAAFEAASRQ
jgi:hypothetical protein